MEIWMTRFQTIRGRRPEELLLAASVLVGIAIALDGPAARAVNGVAGIGWILAAVLLIRGFGPGERTRVLAISAIVGLALVLLVRPSNLLWAAIGFTIGGAIVAWLSASRPVTSGALLAALWLPLHLLVAIAKVIVRSIRDQPATVRTDPPPTAALVPFAMVVAAMIGGWLVERWRTGRVASSARVAAGD
jgi:hypothetical protein